MKLLSFLFCLSWLKFRYEFQLGLPLHDQYRRMISFWDIVSILSNRALTCLCSFVGESMHDDGSLVLAYYKDGASDPTFLYFAHGLKEVKC